MNLKRAAGPIQQVVEAQLKALVKNIKVVRFEYDENADIQFSAGRRTNSG